MSNQSSDWQQYWKTVRPYALGGLSGSMATCCIQPIDMIMKRQQLWKGESMNLISMGSKLIGEEGFLFLYKGLGAGIVRQLTYGTARLGLYGSLLQRWKPKEKNTPTPFTTLLGIAVIAGGVGSFVGTPPDAALVRIQADSTLPVAERRNYKNVFDALYRMAKEEGVRGFFSGAWPTILRGLAINVGMLTSYDPYKRYVEPYTGKDTQAQRFAAGFLSGWTSATVALPFDFIKTRLQQQKAGPDGTLPYRGVLDCFSKVVKQDGLLALYTGYPTFVVRITPHIMLTWVFLDFLNDRL